MPATSTIWFGIVAMVITGTSWCLTGLVMGGAPKRGIIPSLVQCLGALISIPICLIILCCTGFPQATPQAMVFTCGVYALGGVLNFLGLEVMSRAMQRGPNGIIWAITQSALIVPFLAGIVFHHMAPGWIHWTGLMLILVALALFALDKDNATASGSWLPLTALSFIICGLNTTLMTEPSYYPGNLPIDSITRTLANMSGTLLASIVFTMMTMTTERKRTSHSNLRTSALWYYVISLQFCNLVLAFALLYPGMDALAQHGLGGISYPLMIGSCIISFSLCSLLLLKERLRRRSLIALVSCLMGLIAICWQ